MANKEQLPGLNVHINEGSVSGKFEMPPADMQHIRYQGRVVLVLVADAMGINIKDTKDGDTKASWTFKGVDAAIVRDPSMVQHLAKVLYLDGTDEVTGGGIGTIPVTLPVPQPTMVGEYDDEGAFLGFRKDEEDEEYVPSGPEPGDVPKPEPQPTKDEEPDPAFKIVPHRPIENRDPVLARFLNEEVPSGV